MWQPVTDSYDGECLSLNNYHILGREFPRLRFSAQPFVKITFTLEFDRKKRKPKQSQINKWNKINATGESAHKPKNKQL